MDAVARATAIGALAVALWSTLAILTVLAGGVPPLQLVAMTFAIAGSAGMAVRALRRDRAAAAVPRGAWALGVAGLFGYHALYFAALALAPAVEANLINYLWPLLIVLFAGLLPGQRLGPRHLLGAAFGLGGCALAIGGGAGFDPAHLAGYACALGAALTWAGYSVLNRRFGEVRSEAVAEFCLATAVLASLVHLAFETTRWPEGTAWFAVLGLGLGPVGLAFFVWDHGVKHGDLRLLGVLAYFAPVLSTLWLVLAGHAGGGLALWGGCGLVAAGALVATGRAGKRR
ncbi:EamA family transporter [Elioraea sp. Yellowstone]|jgi:drug/metabolite transporter (DMT)-like permease|uniref:aromatic amino acid exporter YddG n=1 Tax=Elioraea sp. Yellowstone TaxID=2592070 RepID=UPI0011508F02|nr:EamA family transporter [Elioraea sp. Yellowstone]TQF79160.1 EamA family transporter [Elioraea sp. Yellowstone]